MAENWVKTPILAACHLILESPCWFLWCACNETSYFPNKPTDLGCRPKIRAS